MSNESIFCECTRTEYELKPGTKRVWVQKETSTEEITVAEYKRYCENHPFFVGIGHERVERGYTMRGYIPVKITSQDRAKTCKVVYQFSKFK